MKEVTAVFDIGKTNKKFFLFDRNFREVYRKYVRLEETADEDGFPCERLETLTSWMREVFEEASLLPEFTIKRLNFSTYGASLVHLDAEGQPVTPLYNYLKPFPEALLEAFYDQYGPRLRWAAETASPVLGMLNSGLQLYWLKHTRPEVFSRITQTLHFPQYCAYLFSGQSISEYTSIGCHTGLWNFKDKDYHRWVYSEGLDHLFPPINPTTSAREVMINGKKVLLGAGIHDSSAALLPYIVVNEEPFILISTGTWSICLNPFSSELLNEADLQQDCLNFLRVDGNTVRAARLFLGNEYKIWVEKLADHFGKPHEAHRTVQYDPDIEKALQRFTEQVFRWESLKNYGQPLEGTVELDIFETYEEAYHQLVKELAVEQARVVKLAGGQTPFKKVYLDGGFVDNQLFIRYLLNQLSGYELITTNSPLGSALGAAMAVHNRSTDPHFFLEHLSLQQQNTVHL